MRHCMVLRHVLSLRRGGGSSSFNSQNGVLLLRDTPISWGLALATTREQSGRRRFGLLRVVRGIHDAVGQAISFGEFVTGTRRSVGTPAQGWQPQRAQGFASRETYQSTPSNSFATSTPTPSQQPSAAINTSPTVDPTSSASLSEQVRSIMRLLPNPVVVCTSIEGDTPRAMTMSSFTSLTLSPMPLVSFNVATPSRTLDAIQSSGHFNIHIMAADASGAAMADRFTRGNSEDVFKGVQYATAAAAATPPVLSDKGVLHVLRCKLLHDAPSRGLMRVRDHVIVVGEVLEMLPGSGVRAFGLGYADRRYRQIGGAISKHE